MILWTLRILFTGGFLYTLQDAAGSSGGPALAGDLSPAYYTAVVVILGVAAGLTWAPVLGGMVSAPLTMTFTNGELVKENRLLLKWIHRLEMKKRRRTVVFLCFLEGLNRPWAPSAIFAGLNNARPGSWFEKVFAKETLRFDNAQQVLKAYSALKRRGIQPNLDHKPEVKVLVASHDRQLAPSRAKVKVGKADPAKVKRNPNIRLFERSTEES